MGILSNVFMQKATTEFMKNIDTLVSEKSDAVTKAKNAVLVAELAFIEAQAARDTLRKALSPTTRGTLYWLASKTRRDGVGHFVELFADATAQCSCEGGRYGGACWATAFIKGANSAKASFTYVLGAGKFDQRVKPAKVNSLHAGFTYLPYGTNPQYGSAVRYTR